MKTTYIKQNTSGDSLTTPDAVIAVDENLIRQVSKTIDVVRNNELSRAARHGVANVRFEEGDDQPDYWEMVCDDSQIWIDAIIKYSDVHVTTAPIEEVELARLYRETPNNTTIEI
jgi:hypothetical protein